MSMKLSWVRSNGSLSLLLKVVAAKFLLTLDMYQLVWTFAIRHPYSIPWLPVPRGRSSQETVGTVVVGKRFNRDTKIIVELA